MPEINHHKIQHQVIDFDMVDENYFVTNSQQTQFIQQVIQNIVSIQKQQSEHEQNLQQAQYFVKKQNEQVQTIQNLQISKNKLCQNESHMFEPISLNKSQQILYSNIQGQYSKTQRQYSKTQRQYSKIQRSYSNNQRSYSNTQRSYSNINKKQYPNKSKASMINESDVEKSLQKQFSQYPQYYSNPQYQLKQTQQPQYQSKQIQQSQYQLKQKSHNQSSINQKNGLQYNKQNHQSKQKQQNDQSKQKQQNDLLCSNQSNTQILADQINKIILVDQNNKQILVNQKNQQDQLNKNHQQNIITQNNDQHQNYQPQACFSYSEQTNKLIDFTQIKNQQSYQEEDALVIQSVEVGLNQKLQFMNNNQIEFRQQQQVDASHYNLNYIANKCYMAQTEISPKLQPQIKNYYINQDFIQTNQKLPSKQVQLFNHKIKNLQQSFQQLQSHEQNIRYQSKQQKNNEQIQQDQQLFARQILQTNISLANQKLAKIRQLKQYKKRKLQQQLTKLNQQITNLSQKQEQIKNIVSQNIKKKHTSPQSKQVSLNTDNYTNEKSNQIVHNKSINYKNLINHNKSLHKSIQKLEKLDKIQKIDQKINIYIQQLTKLHYQPQQKQIQKKQITIIQRMKQKQIKKLAQIKKIQASSKFISQFYGIKRNQGQFRPLSPRAIKINKIINDNPKKIINDNPKK